MTSKIEVLIPQGVVRVSKTSPSPRLGGLAGKIIGFVNNGKPNSDVLLSRLANRMQRNYHLSGIISKAKPRVTDPADFIEELVGKCDGVVNALGD